MNELLATKQENKETVPLSVDELTQKLRTLRDVEDKIFDDKQAADSKIERIIVTRKEFVESLIQETSRFKGVFKTSNRSVYFLLESGESLRAKMTSASDDYEFGNKEHFIYQPIMKDVFFIDQEEVGRIKFLEHYPGEEITLSDCAVGVSPFELNIKGFGSRIVFEKKNNVLRLIGTEFVNKDSVSELDTEGNLVGGIHIGHPITEIIK